MDWVIDRDMSNKVSIISIHSKMRSTTERRPDILFIHPNAANIIYQDLGKSHSAIETPIWGGLLASRARSQGFGVEVLDCEANNLSYKSAAMAISDIGARINCFVIYGQQPSASSQNMEGGIGIAEELSLIGGDTGKVLFVGGHIAALPTEVLSYNFIDFVCQNEGSDTISKLLCVEDLECANYLELVSGLGWKDGGSSIRLNKIGELGTNLDKELPGVAWDLLPSASHYRTAGWHSWSNGSIKSPFASLYTSLGCPFKCSFCMINIINRTSNAIGTASDKSATFRRWSTEHILGEFDKLANMGIKNIKIADELFVLREDHYLPICSGLISRGYDFNIWCYSRIDTCKPKNLEIMKRAGINWIGLGIESPNQAVRSDVIKGGYKEVKITDVLSSISNAGINVGANYIFGLPEDTEETMRETFDFATTMNTENCNFYCAMAYPGSPLYWDAISRGWVPPKSYSSYSQHSYLCENLPSKYLSAAEILRFRDDCWHTYFTSEKYLSKVGLKFGIAAMEDIKSTTTIRLRRKLLGD